MEYLTLRNGVKISMNGFGVYQIKKRRLRAKRFGRFEHWVSPHRYGLILFQ